MPDAERLPPTRTPLLDIPFVYESYRDLTTKLGAVDGHAASMAIAANFFTDLSNLQLDKQAFGLLLANTYRVSTRFIDLDNLATHLHQLLIVGTTKHWEDFLIRFRQEQVALGRVWRKRNDGEDQLSYILDCIQGGKVLNIRRIGPERFDLLQYYRLVRNATAHEIDKRARLDKEFDNVRQHEQLVKENYGVDAPNPFAKLTFDDHMLYTRIAKYVATDLCRLTPPATLSEIHKVLTDRSNFSHSPENFIHKYKGQANKLRASLREFFRQHYNYEIDNDPSIADQTIEWINSIPNKRARRAQKAGPLRKLLASNPVHERD